MPFLPGLHGPFLLDDWGNLAPLLGVTADPLHIYSTAFANGSGLLNRPVSNLSFIGNLLTAGPVPAVFKLTNLAIHIATGAVVYLFGLRLLALLVPASRAGQRHLAAALACAIWMLHPLQVSTVLYVVQRMAMLSALFSLVAVYAAIGTLSSGAERRSMLGPALLAFVATVLAVLSKENGALVPLLLAAVLWPLASLPDRASSGNRLRWLWTYAVGIPVTAGLALLLAKWDFFVGSYEGRGFTLLERVLTEPFVLLGYLRSIVLPHPDFMALFLDDTPVRYPNQILPWLVMIALIAVAATTLLMRHRFPLLAFAVGWFIACHAMESTVFPLELAFEHRNYLALFGPALFVAFSITTLAGRIKSRAAGVAFALIPLLVLAWATHERANRWSSEARFAMAEVANRPDSIRAQNLAAIVELRRGDLDGPIARMERMKAMYPNEFFPHAMDLDFACDRESHPIDWGSIHRTALPIAHSSEILGYFNHTTMKVRDGACAGISIGELDAQLATLAAKSLARNSLFAAQYFTVLRAALIEQSNIPEARARMLDALAINPESSELLERIVMFEIQSGDATRALLLIDKLDSKTAAYTPAQYRWDRLRELAERDTPRAQLR